MTDDTTDKGRQIFGLIMREAKCYLNTAYVISGVANEMHKEKYGFGLFDDAPDDDDPLSLLSDAEIETIREAIGTIRPI